MQTEAGKAFVHEAYRYQALPPENRNDFAASMAARARPRTAAGALSANSAGRDRGARFCSALERTQRGRGDDLAETLWTSGLVDEGFYSDESEGGEGNGDAGVEGSGNPAPICEGGDTSGGDGARVGPFSGNAAKQMGEKEGRDGSTLKHEKGESPGKSHLNAASPTRRSWGAGLRMYV